MRFKVTERKGPGATRSLAGSGKRRYNKKAGFNSGLLATFYTENSTKSYFRCGAADLRLSATHGPTTAFLHRQCPYHTRTPCPLHVTSCGDRQAGPLSRAAHAEMRLERPRALTMLASMGASSYSDLERGLRNPGIRNVARLAKALGLSTAELCKGVDG